jgi:DNA repair protein RecO (recombination protein O)
MLHQTRGIALHTVKFSETSIIAKVYTELFGLQSYMIKGARRHGSKIRPGLFQPLTLLEMTVYRKEKNSLHTLKEAGIIHPYQTLHADIRKSSMALFIAELVYKSIGEEEPNPALFSFLTETCLHLDGPAGILPVFPLFFAVKLTKFLGIMPENNRSAEKPFFLLDEGHFGNDPSGLADTMDASLSGHFSFFLDASFDTLEEVSIPRDQRNLLLEKILHYYKLHLAGFREVKSHTVLHSVLS